MFISKGVTIRQKTVDHALIYIYAHIYIYTYICAYIYMYIYMCV
jgi:hypothetical protein